MDHKAALEQAKSSLGLAFYKDQANLAACYLDLRAKAQASLDIWQSTSPGFDDLVKADAALRECLEGE